MTLLAVGSQICGIVLGIQKIINYTEDRINDELQFEPVIDLVELRKQMIFLQETLNTSLPIPSLSNKELMSFAKKGEASSNAVLLFAKMKEVVSESIVLIPNIDGVEHWDSWKEVIDNIEKIVDIIHDVADLALISKDLIKDIGEMTNIEFAEAMSLFLDDKFKATKIIEVIDKYVFKLISYYAIISYRKIMAKITNAKNKKKAAELVASIDELNADKSLDEQYTEFAAEVDVVDTEAIDAEYEYYKNSNIFDDPEPNVV